MIFSLVRLILNFVVRGQVLATICEELPPDSVMLIYLSASGLYHFYISGIIIN
jgi:hypothetical protein